MKKNISRLIGAGLLIGALSGCPKADVSLPLESSKSERLEQITLRVGEIYSNSSFTEEFAMRYCGMISEDTFSLSDTNRESVNLFYSTFIKEFTFMGHRSIYSFKLNRITPEEIELTCLGEIKRH